MEDRETIGKNKGKMKEHKERKWRNAQRAYLPVIPYLPSNENSESLQMYSYEGAMVSYKLHLDRVT